MTQTRAGRHGHGIGLIGLMAGLVSLTGGCNIFMPLFLMGQHKERIPAEYDKLAGKTVAIAVWADQETLFDYPYVRMELALHIADQLTSNMKDLKVADGRLVEDYMQRNLSNAVDPIGIGRKFKCDSVVYLELLDFQIRDPDSPDFLEPVIRASVTVYDLKTDPDEPKTVELTPVEVKQQGQLFNETSAQIARKGLYEEFAAKVAQKFYEHKVEMMK